MQIRCGHCKGYHDTVAQVRACSNLATVQSDTPVTEEGIYTVDGAVYKVLLSGSGRLYASIFTVESKKFEYAPGRIKWLRAEHRMTQQQAAEFGHLHGVCCACSRLLSRDESVKRGYGPTCADNNGWEYDHAA
jgi:Family of unknown function (DUF6011)